MDDILGVGYPTISVLGGIEMEAVVREYDAKLDSKKRLTLREAGYEYYHVSVLPDQRIILEPRVLTTPFEVSANTLKTRELTFQRQR